MIKNSLSIFYSLEETFLPFPEETNVSVSGRKAEGPGRFSHICRDSIPSVKVLLPWTHKKKYASLSIFNNKYKKRRENKNISYVETENKCNLFNT